MWGVPTPNSRTSYQFSCQSTQLVSQGVALPAELGFCAIVVIFCCFYAKDKSTTSLLGPKFDKRNCSFIIIDPEFLGNFSC